MIEREPFKPTIRKEDFWEEEEKYLIGVEHYRQAIFLPALTIEEIVDLQAAINNLLSEKQQRMLNDIKFPRVGGNSNIEPPMGILN